VLVDDAVDEHVQGMPRRSRPPVDAVEVEEADERHEVGDVEGQERLGELPDDGDELRLVLLAPRPERGPESDVGGELEGELADVGDDDGARLRQGPDEAVHLGAHGAP